MNLKRFHLVKNKSVLGLMVASLAVLAWATPPLGFVVNQILAKGVTAANIRQHAEVEDPSTASGEGREKSEWEAEVETHGATDFYIQHLVLAPGGYSGWHSHPGILMGTVVSGSIDFYNDKCEKTTIGPGEMYFEGTKRHGIINNGAINADLNIAYLIKHDTARRIEADAPACAAVTGIP